MSSELSKRVNELSELIDFLCFFKTHISYFQASVVSILQLYTREKTSSLRFIDACLDLCGDKDFPYAWNKALSENKLRLAEANSILSDFGNRVGTSDTETQLKYIDYCLAEISRYLRIAENKEQENKKLYIILGVSAGLLSAIMII